MNSYNILAQCFGLEREYRRCLFMLLSLLAHVGKTNVRIILFTDNIEYFKLKLPSNLNINYELLTPERIKEMRGKSNFLHRMKIAIIEHTFLNYDGKILYADSDSFFINNPDELLHKISEQNSSMHIAEYQYKSLLDLRRPAGNTFIEFAELIRDNDFTLSNQLKVKYSLEMFSWNAGVMAFHPKHIKLINDVYALTEQFYLPTKNHASEQYAFSILLQQNTNIIPSYKYNYHYWNRVEKEIMDSFLEKLFTNNFFVQDFDDILDIVKKHSILLPKFIKNHKLKLQDNAVQHFCENNYPIAYLFSIKALLKGALFDLKFIKHILYHTKRMILNG